MIFPLVYIPPYDPSHPGGICCGSKWDMLWPIAALFGGALLLCLLIIGLCELGEWLDARDKRREEDEADEWRWR